MDLYYKTVFPTIGGVGVIANTLLIAALYKERKLKRPFQMTILSLTVADLLNCIWLTVAGATFPPVTHKMFPVYHQIFSSLIAFSLITSLLHLMFVSLQRLVAVLLPFRSKHLITSQRCAIVLALIWLTTAIVVALFYAVSLKETMFILVPVLTFICALLLILSYSFICYRVRLRKRLASTASSSQSEYILLYSILVTVLFIICTFPANVTIMYYRKLNDNLKYVAFLQWLNPVMDPSIYFLSKKIRRRKKKQVEHKNQSEEKPTPQGQNTSETTSF
eukprot:gene8362-14333_t